MHDPSDLFGAESVTQGRHLQGAQRFGQLSESALAEGVAGGFEAQRHTALEIEKCFGNSGIDR